MPRSPLPQLSTFVTRANSASTSGGKALGVAAVLLATISSTTVSTTGSEGAEAAEPDDKFKDTAMFPPLAAYKKGTLQVSPVHTIAYSMYGNPDGKPVLFVHGGPGGGTNPAMARYFDPLSYNVILVDQRGCGDSEPFAHLEDNTTYDSVRDFEKIRELLKIDKWQVFGGSWGSTLALAYAMEHPTKVMGNAVAHVYGLCSVWYSAVESVIAQCSVVCWRWRRRMRWNTQRR